MDTAVSEFSSVDDILAENSRRLDVINTPFDPVTGFNSVGDRFAFEIPDFAIPKQWLPVSMRDVPLVRLLKKYGSIHAFVENHLHTDISKENHDKVAEAFIRLRFRHDFPFWAATLVYIKNKEGGEDVLFRLSRPQRKFVSVLEQKRLENKPIRLVLLKARQWGGSTTSQIYMAWLQLVHKKGLNSLIIAHVRDGSIEIKDMFDRMLKSYPANLLYPLGKCPMPTPPKSEGVGGSPNIQRIPARNCKIKIGTVEKPDSCRGGDYSLVHCSEVGVWRKTEGKSPQDIVQSACSGILMKPYTMVVYESTANGTGNFFQREYDAAKDPETPSQFEPLFISWFDIDQYSLSFASDDERRAFAEWLFKYRLGDVALSAREEPGAYLWRLWLYGATLEAIHWYVEERKGKDDHGVMASEYPSDDIEAFVHSGAMVFSPYVVDALRPSCRPPRFTGELLADADEGPQALENIHFCEDVVGKLAVWELPDIPDDCFFSDRYLVVVDIGGRGDKADWSVVVVFDRLDMLEPGGKPSVVAQWRGHCDIDRLAWKAAQIAAFYDDALLVIESNTLETHDRNHILDGGDQSQFILNQIKDVYPNLYARRQSEEEIRQGLPRKYGFHTNIATKPMVISSLVRAVRDRLFAERSELCLDELLTYERKPNGAYGAIDGKHDDILMTRAIGLHICFNEMDMPSIIQNPKSKIQNSKRSPVSEASF